MAGFAATVVKWISCGPPKAASQVRFLPVAPELRRTKPAQVFLAGFVVSARGQRTPPKFAAPCRPRPTACTGAHGGSAGIRRSIGTWPYGSSASSPTPGRPCGGARLRNGIQGHLLAEPLRVDGVCRPAHARPVRQRVPEQGQGAVPWCGAYDFEQPDRSGDRTRCSQPRALYRFITQPWEGQELRVHIKPALIHASRVAPRSARPAGAAADRPESP